MNMMARQLDACTYLGTYMGRLEGGREGGRERELGEARAMSPRPRHSNPSHLVACHVLVVPIISRA